MADKIALSPLYWICIKGGETKQVVPYRVTDLRPTVPFSAAWTRVRRLCGQPRLPYFQPCAAASARPLDFQRSRQIRDTMPPGSLTRLDYRFPDPPRVGAGW